ncbi:polygalacturonase ADPG1-like [Musa acuminata AAA Group]|uniref:polygalacturonase ADPG1-like n=1 Tax=Musa acuminata AAA Group TaxID=214697 RepID=UPI0031DFAB36
MGYRDQLEKLADRENEIEHHMLEKRVGVSALLHEGREDVVVVPAVSELQLPGLDAKLEPSTCATLHVSVASMATWSHLLNRQTNSRKMKRWRLATAALSKAIAEAFSRRSSASVSGSLPKGLVNSIMILVLACFIAGCVAASNYSVTDFGAKGDGVTDDTKAFLDTWNATCQSSVSSILLIPAGKTFLLNPIVFQGPCQFYVRVQVLRLLVAVSKLMETSYGPANSGEEKLITGYCSAISIACLSSDPGRLTVREPLGGRARPIKLAFRPLHFPVFVSDTLRSTQLILLSTCLLFLRFLPQQCSVAPNTLALLFCSRALVADLRLINSPQMHLVVGFSSTIRITGVTITAPGDSPNTDGIHIQQSHHVNVSDSTIGTGDDCISIGTGSFHVNVSWVTCGPGHGISVGSLGMNNSRAEVSDIQVGHCNISSTMNGVRIKTWQGGYGYAKTIIFENINFTAVKNPIIIDQHYCATGVCAEKSSAVQVTDVRFIEVRGTSSSQVAINLNCSQNVACTGITIQNVEIQPAQQGGQASSYCFNAHGTVTGVAMPAVPCLMP